MAAAMTNAALGGGQGEDADGDVLGVGRVQRPGELGPGPPDQPEDHARAGDTGRVEVVRGQHRHLGHREHEDQIEEQLDERDGLGFGCVQAGSEASASEQYAERQTSGDAGERQCRRKRGFSWGLASSRALIWLASTGFENR